MTLYGSKSDNTDVNQRFWYWNAIAQFSGLDSIFKVTPITYFFHTRLFRRIQLCTFFACWCFGLKYRRRVVAIGRRYVWEICVSTSGIRRCVRLPPPSFLIFYHDYITCMYRVLTTLLTLLEVRQRTVRHYKTKTIDWNKTVGRQSWNQNFA